jgi:formylglycine-generating enzyme required for sulfatase activity
MPQVGSEDTLRAREAATRTGEPDTSDPRPTFPQARMLAPLQLRDPERYRIIAEHGRGGLGRVMRAVDRELDREVAIKELTKRSEIAEARFFREALITARLEHPGIVPIHEAGCWPDGTPFYVMKLVAGRSIKELIARCASVHDRMALLHHVIAVADAVAYAHARDIIHRDLKPANVIAGEHGETIVLDWGLAKAVGERDVVETDQSTADSAKPDDLTIAGSILGTPLYMPPEQARGERVDQRADVYAIGAMLWELSSPAPIPPNTQERAHALRQHGVDADLIAIIIKALETDAGRRYRDAGELAKDLHAFRAGARIGARRYSIPALVAHTIRRHRVLAGTIATIVILAVVGAVLYQREASRVRAEAARIHEDEVAQAIRIDLAEGDRVVSDARSSAEARARARTTAFAAWDRQETSAGETAWARALELGEHARRQYSIAATSFERALLRDPSREDVRVRLADLLLELALLADDDHRIPERDELAARLAVYDTSGERQARLLGAGELAVDVAPTGARVELARYDGSERAELVSGVSRTVGVGAWIVTATAPVAGPVRLPLLLARGESRRVALVVPRSIPAGYIYMPPGDGLYGSSDPELKRAWLNAVVTHIVRTDGYLIAQHETTFADWIEYLDDLDTTERERRRPRVGNAAVDVRGSLALSRGADGWRLAIQATTRRLEARWGEDLVVPARDRRVAQDWRRMPVTAISYDDVVAYTQWLHRTKRLANARPCTEHEWERAARGTVVRRFPHGNTLEADDANVNRTYGKRPETFGLDEVGSHPKSRSPFGIDDLAGNALEWTSKPNRNEIGAVRGGAFFYGPETALLANRESPEASFRGIAIGARICASFTPTP